MGLGSLDTILVGLLVLVVIGMTVTGVNIEEVWGYGGD